MKFESELPAVSPCVEPHPLSAENARLRAELQRSQDSLRLYQSLLGTLNHDLRSPLATAKIGVQALLTFPEDGAARPEVLERVERSLSRLESVLARTLENGEYPV